MPPSVDTLRERLEKRGSESSYSLSKRLHKAQEEIDKSNQFDKVVLNDDFVLACEKTLKVIKEFI